MLFYGSSQIRLPTSSFSAADLELIFAAHQRVDLNKGDFILEEGQIAQAYYVLEEGLIRSFLYDYHGHDITTGFVGEKEVVIEVSSFFSVSRRRNTCSV